METQIGRPQEKRRDIQRFKEESIKSRKDIYMYKNDCKGNVLPIATKNCFYFQVCLVKTESCNLLQFFFTLVFVFIGRRYSA